LRSKNEEISHFFASLRASEFWKASAFSELTDAFSIASLGHGFASQKPETRPQALNLPQNSLAQLILFESHAPRFV